MNEQIEDAVIVHDKRRDYESVPDIIEADAPEVGEVVEPAPAGKELIVASKPIEPQKPPVMHVPSLTGGTIQFNVGELFPWRGVFWMVADVKTLPAPHMVIVPVDHTGSHKKRAAKLRPTFPVILGGKN